MIITFIFSFLETTCTSYCYFEQIKLDQMDNHNPVETNTDWTVKFNPDVSEPIIETNFGLNLNIDGC